MQQVAQFNEVICYPVGGIVILNLLFQQFNPPVPASAACRYAQCPRSPT